MRRRIAIVCTGLVVSGFGLALAAEHHVPLLWLNVAEGAWIVFVLLAVIWSFRR